ncbi:cilia- and flagella-associated protein [Histomonas meleagridis]|uniref:cilia- and flagella-associated protein n=1 Tax=Histomonas meleagridis TaxID=135588 RepID=UPI00355A5E84|nr:cilia- and flagella-associated protein [Histomonas meleagridis]KAH0801285.1 cilia- and flagella-associated protein [Histomonas meleagridis]
MDDEEIHEYMDISNGGVTVDDNKTGNPFLLQPTKELFLNSKFYNRKSQIKKDRIQRSSLVERSVPIKPTFFSCETRSTQIRSSLRKNRSNSITVTPRSISSIHPKERKLTMNEFVQDKREIYQLQLIIQKKKREALTLLHAQSKQDKALQSKEAKINESNNQFKSQTHKIESLVATERSTANSTTRSIISKQSELKKLTLQLESLRSEHDTKTSTIELYKRYKSFIRIFSPQCLNSPHELVDALERMQEENLLLINIFNNAENSASVRALPLIQTNSYVSSELQRAENRKIDFPEENNFSNSIKSEEMELEIVENELHKIGKIVAQTYEKCFGDNAQKEMSTQSLLERIERKLEEMIQVEKYIDPIFAKEKRDAKAEERKEENRKKQAEKRQEEHRKKVERTMKRAATPIPKKEKRPIAKRMLPMVHRARGKTAEVLEKEELENKFLFDNDFEVECLYNVKNRN